MATQLDIIGFLKYFVHHFMHFVCEILKLEPMRSSLEFRKRFVRMCVVMDLPKQPDGLRRSDKQQHVSNQMKTFSKNVCFFL